ncbi:MAG: hypothetical protein IJT02_03400 [Synergistaceae bacterium]|nr:hypothetical protein [Synergistaceae bacterium]
MDDDTIPFPDALENLLNAAELLDGKASYLKSMVYDVDGELAGDVTPDLRAGSNTYHDWHERLTDGLLKTRETTFVSLLVNSKTVEKCGLPCKYYFIWSDDHEYGLRLTEYYGPGYFCGHSKVYHKRPGIKTLSVLDEPNTPRLRNYYYMYRNDMTNDIIYYGKKRALKQMLRSMITALKALVHPQGFKRFRIVLAGTVSGLWFWRKVRRFIKSQVKA